MFIDRDAVKAELSRKLQFVEIAIVELVALLRIEISVRQYDPGSAIFLRVAHVQIGIRHEMKKEDFHGATLRMNWQTWSAKICGCSTCSRCAQPGSVAMVEPAMRALSVSA